jgi:hypothetical protein
MRYISVNPGLMLLTEEGQSRHIFFNGVLTVGDNTTRDGNSATGTPTSGYVIDAFDKSGTFYSDLMFIRPADLSGNTAGTTWTSRAERVGMGTLTLTTATGATLGSLRSGWDGSTFFEAPLLDASAGVTPGTSGAWYSVETGSVTYGTSTYRTGQVFMSVGTGDASGDGTIALTLPLALVDGCNPYYSEAFKITKTMNPDDFLNYWDPTAEQGYEPRNTSGTADDTFYGYVSKGTDTSI